MNTLTLNRFVAFSLFAVTLIVYVVTLAPTVVFWDVGEFIAAAWMMQVPHPPGSPLFLLVTRIATMIPIASDIAVRAHALSALFSALAVMFLYLVIVRVLIAFRGVPESIADKLTVHGSAAIGSLALAFSSSYWGNAIEAEVYAASMFFLNAILWLIMRWRERADEPMSERYLVLIAYLVGLSLGVHLLALLATFPVLMVVYFRRYEVNPRTFVIFGMIAVAVFFTIYPGIVKYLPGMMDGEFQGKKSELMKWIPWLVILAVLYGAYVSYKRRQRVLHIALLSMLVILLGYTTYTGVIIRSNAQPPMNENDPSTLQRLTSYLGREQYGEAPLFFPRRWSQEPHQQGMYTAYSSDWDFLFRYQLHHMFNRYLLWNFVGAAGGAQDSDWAWKPTLGIPFLIGLFGLFALFQKDWKLGLVFLVAFIVLGPVLALFQNQQEPQPRERDYFYVGAFAIFALWISVGIAALIDALRQTLKAGPSLVLPAAAVLTLATVAVPGRLLHMNWQDLNRAGNYLAWDYSYNILQTCEPDAILFTNGDNDTFPLWYLQDVEGIRRDVRIVNLSLVNTPWYIRQMKEKPYYPEAKAVPISLSDARIANISPIAWEPRQLDLPVPPEVIQRHGVTDSSVVSGGKITFTLYNTLQIGGTKAIRVQDILVHDIIMTNQWKRPIYFAVTVAPDSKIGLDEYLWFHGLAWRLEPRKISRDDLGINASVLEANLLSEPQGFSKTFQYGYRFRNVGSPDVHFDENQSRLMLNYRTAFMRLSLHYASAQNDTPKAVAALERMEALIPRSKVAMGWELESDLANFYWRLGRLDQYNQIVAGLEVQMNQLIASGRVNMNSYYNPYRVLLEIYENKREYQKTLDLLQGLAVQFPSDPGLQRRIEQIRQLVAEQRAGGDTTAADTVVGG